MDLVAMNIQRGRDHGVPTYSSARRWCGLPRLATWAALTRVMSPEAVVRLAGVYRTVEDIDLYIGGVAERPIDGGLVGPTFQVSSKQESSGNNRPISGVSVAFQ